eukprot:Hpha_TRINITY_DN6635_c0_g1::TRINITY_DN6635_c0_g1_i1::g.26516::m.26516
MFGTPKLDGVTVSRAAARRGRRADPHGAHRAALLSRGGPPQRSGSPFHLSPPPPRRGSPPPPAALQQQRSLSGEEVVEMAAEVRAAALWAENAAATGLRPLPPFHCRDRVPALRADPLRCRQLYLWYQTWMQGASGSPRNARNRSPASTTTVQQSVQQLQPPPGPV